MDYNYSYFALLPNLPTDSPSVDELNKLANLQHRRPKQPEGWWSRRLAYGLLFAIVLAVSVAAATQVTQETLAQKNFNAAFLLIWFSTTWLTICYPMYFLLVWINAKLHNRDHRPTARAAWKIYGGEQFNVLTALFRTGCFTVIWTGTLYCYCFALRILSATDVSALLSSAPAFVFFFSWTILHERFEGTKLFASIFSLAGIIIMSYVDGFLWDNPSLTGVLLGVGTSVGAAMYQVIFKRLICDANYGQISLLLSGIGVFNLVFLWPVTLALYLTKVEQWEWNHIPWNWVGGGAALQFGCNVLLNYGMDFIYGTFITLGIALALPLNGLVDHFVRHVVFRPIEITGFILMSVGFCLALLPINWTQWVRKHLPCPSLRKDPDEEALKNHYVHTPRDLLRMSMAAAKKKQQA